MYVYLYKLIIHTYILCKCFLDAINHYFKFLYSDAKHFLLQKGAIELKMTYLLIGKRKNHTHTTVETGK